MAKSPEQLARLRSQFGKQAKLVSEGLSPATISRVERGFSITEETARALHLKIAPALPFEDLFELASAREGRTQFTWDQVSLSAAQIGTKVFQKFKPHFIISFAGPSSIFTNLLMTKSLTREEFLRVVEYLAVFQRKKRGAGKVSLKGFDAIESERFIVQIPKEISQIENRSAKRVSIIDDTVTTGSVLEHLKDYLVAKGYKRKNIQYVTCVCSDTAFASERTRPDAYSYKVKGAYRMPWGDPL